ncbi:MAG: glycosyltransferase family 39 protein [Candidatus Curtissbacteria bacterium]|nr:glycosyltransferase family 39 protein [Candidatus Curtissbacteria bacterium]
MANRKVTLDVKRNLAVILLLVFATAQFILILRHKNPYVSDSYFYKHTYYQLKGLSYDEAQAKIISEVDLIAADEITRNFFQNKETYANSYSFFQKRPFYPLTAYLASLFNLNDYLSFQIPVFTAYILSVILVFRLSKEGLGYFFAIISTALFVSFYPFLDSSTYFLTDTIGFAFWLSQIFTIYNYIKSKKSKWLIFFFISLSISLLNREQSVLMAPLLMSALVLQKLLLLKGASQIKKLLFVSFIPIILFITVSFMLKLPNIYDTISYTQNNYGLRSNKFTAEETFRYMANAIKISHYVFIRDIVSHHWWLLLSALAAVSALRSLVKGKRNNLDILIVSSALASYLAIFIYPVLSYRYFLPIVFAVSYFSVKILRDYNKEVMSKNK